MAYTCCAALILLPHTYVSSQLENPNKKTILCILSIWARSSQKDTQIKIQFPPLRWTPWWQRPHSKTDPLVQPSPDNKFSFSLKETLPPGSSEAWSSLNRPWTGTGRCKAIIQKCGYNEDGQAACECGDELTMKHLLVCPATTLFQRRPVRVQPPSLFDLTNQWTCREKPHT